MFCPYDRIVTDNNRGLKNSFIAVGLQVHHAANSFG